MHFTATSPLLLAALPVSMTALTMLMAFTVATLVPFAMLSVAFAVPVAALMLFAIAVVAAVLAVSVAFTMAAAVALAIAAMAAAAGLQEEADAGHKALEAFQQHAARAGYVKAHEAFSNRAIYRANGQL